MGKNLNKVVNDIEYIYLETEKVVGSLMPEFAKLVDDHTLVPIHYPNFTSRDVKQFFDPLQKKVMQSDLMQSLSFKPVYQLQSTGDKMKDRVNNFINSDLRKFYMDRLPKNIIDKLQQLSKIYYPDSNNRKVDHQRTAVSLYLKTAILLKTANIIIKSNIMKPYINNAIQKGIHKTIALFEIPDFINQKDMKQFFNSANQTIKGKKNTLLQNSFIEQNINKGLNFIKSNKLKLPGSIRMLNLILLFSCNYYDYTLNTMLGLIPETE
jgi:translation initiation factor 2 beta subunit (eIF-2beta)/eIF-5